jgi:hypothetical protein
VNKKGAKVYPYVLEKEDLCRMMKEVKEEGFIAPSVIPVLKEGKIKSKRRRG